MAADDLADPTRRANALAATIQQKLLAVSALLRDLDNHPISLDADVRAQLDWALEMLGCRISATRALLRLPTDTAAA